MSVARRQFMSTKKYVDFNLKMRLTYPKGHQTKFIAGKQKNKIWFGNQIDDHFWYFIIL